jgi:hypothetical protein
VPLTWRSVNWGSSCRTVALWFYILVLYHYIKPYRYRSSAAEVPTFTQAQHSWKLFEKKPVLLVKWFQLYLWLHLNLFSPMICPYSFESTDCSWPMYLIWTIPSRRSHRIKITPCICVSRAWEVGHDCWSSQVTASIHSLDTDRTHCHHK